MSHARTAAEAIEARKSRDIDERSLHDCMRRFVKRWTEHMDARDAAEFQADLTLVLQAVHRDASRETHALLRNALAAMPPAPIFIEKK